MGKLFWKKNSSAILTCIGAAGVVATTVLAVKATPKAMRLLEEAQKEKGEELTTVEVIKTAAPAYVPAAAAGVGTLACIFGANALNKRQQASLMSAYALLNTSYKEYKKHANQVFGDNASRQIEEAVAISNGVIKKVEDSKNLFFDSFSMQFYNSTIEDVRKAEQEINDSLEKRGWVSLTEYYNLVGMPCTRADDELGWSTGAGYAYGYNRIKFEYEDGPNGSTIVVLVTEPTPDYYLY